MIATQNILVFVVSLVTSFLVVTGYKWYRRRRYGKW